MSAHAEIERRVVGALAQEVWALAFAWLLVAANVGLLALWGFTPVAFSGLETKVRDRASYVMVQNDIRFVFTAPLTPDGEIAEVVKDISSPMARTVSSSGVAWSSLCR